MNRYVLIAGIICAEALGVSAQTQSKQVRRLEKQRTEMQKKIEKTSRELQLIQKHGAEEHKRLKLVQEQVANRKEVISVIGKEMEVLQGQIDSLGGRIAHLRNRESRILAQYAQSVKALQHSKEGRNQMIFLLSAKSIGEARERQHFLSKYALSASRLAKELKETRGEIQRTQDVVNATHEQKAVTLALRDKERKALEVEEGKHSSNISNLKGQEKKLSQDLARQRRQASQLDAQIQAQIAAEIAAAEARARKEQELRERKRRQAQASKQSRTKEPNKEEVQTQEKETDASQSETSRQSSIRGGYAMDAAERKLSGGFAQNRGRLPMPVRGRYDLVRRFGMQQHSEFSRVSISNGGIDLRVYGDRNAYCVFEGVVSRVFVTSGYGQSVIVRHGNYLTVYANLSSVRVSSGQHISSGSVIGTISSDDSDGRGNILHFQLWHERSKQNPEAWLRR